MFWELLHCGGKTAFLDHALAVYERSGNWLAANEKANFQLEELQALVSKNGKTSKTGLGINGKTAAGEKVGKITKEPKNKK